MLKKMVKVHLEEPYWTYALNYPNESEINQNSFLTHVFIDTPFLAGPFDNVLRVNQTIADITFVSVSPEVLTTGATCCCFIFSINSAKHHRRFLPAV